MRFPPSALALAALLLLSPVPVPHVANAAGGHPLPLLGAAPPASMALSADLSPVPAQPAAIYDEQMGATFTQNFTSLDYNVTAVAQSDANGYGPGYLLNGETRAGYWYQVGVSFDWPDTTGTYFPGFGFNYQVYGPQGKPVFPTNGGAGEEPFSGAVNSGDIVLLSLNFTSSSVLMQARDWNTGATGSVSFSNEGSSVFAGNPFSSTDPRGYFSGLMTEWYHAAVYTGNTEEVAYSNQLVALTSAWMWMDEFQSGASRSLIFSNQTGSPVIIANENQLYPFSAGGATEYVSAHRFITGMLSNATSSRVTLTPAAPEASPPGFAASYSLDGRTQTASLGDGTALLQADPGSLITVSINSSSGSPDRWVFAGTSGAVVTFAAGTNVTYVYYHLVEETVAYKVAGAGATPASAPRLTYEEPPAAASGTPSLTTVTRSLGTTPTVVFMLVGSEASINGNIPGVPGERWVASAQSWSVTAPDSIPNPIEFYHQYDVSVRYTIVGGGTPPQAPEFNATAFGSQVAASLSGGATTGWFDAGSRYSFTPFLNGSTLTERWQQAGGGGLAGESIQAPGETITGNYVHQFFTDFGVNDLSGGTVNGTLTGTFANGTASGNFAQGPSWTDAGLRLALNAVANQGWQFEEWSGSGPGSYNGTDPSVGLAVTGPLNENATFYVQLAISADGATEITYSSSLGTGIVQAGTAKTLYVPPSSNVTLSASSSSLLYSFGSWKGSGLRNPTKPSLAVVVDSPTAVTATSTYNYSVISVIAGAVVLLVVAVSLFLIWRRRNSGLYVFGPP